jgi:hypothetical protein
MDYRDYALEGLRIKKAGNVGVHVFFWGGE